MWADGEELAAPSWPPPPSPVSAWATPPLANTAPMPSVIAPALSHVDTPNGRRTPQP
ncbi:hypothetical protein [Mycolicibacterium madagascariense]|uniref:hypothetical protein n=1 Tax=Mycolicibacterium madagascariense TaxID=212765 RepID=UPI0013D2C7DE|nr:hypothetical protein [Mycolicibacterium madagascariense]MCV7010920.1 hypothetical protein [Mycolicibacterium madagascariense]